MRIASIPPACQHSAGPRLLSSPLIGTQDLPCPSGRCGNAQSSGKSGQISPNRITCWRFVSARLQPPLSPPSHRVPTSSLVSRRFTDSSTMAARLETAALAAEYADAPSRDTSFTPNFTVPIELEPLSPYVIYEPQGAWNAYSDIRSSRGALGDVMLADGTSDPIRVVLQYLGTTATVNGTLSNMAEDVLANAKANITTNIEGWAFHVDDAPVGNPPDTAQDGLWRLTFNASTGELDLDNHVVALQYDPKSAGASKQMTLESASVQVGIIAERCVHGTDAAAVLVIVRRVGGAALV